MPQVGAWTLSFPFFIDGGKEAAEGALMAQTFIAEPSNERRASFLTSYARKYKVKKIPVPMAAAQGYDAVYVLVYSLFGIRDGNGIVFVSNTGDVTPSGFLPLTVGNVKQSSLVSLYRDDPMLRSLRDPDQFKGRCGSCEYRDWCGGSRARAYAWTGDPLESDPLCPYVPRSGR